MTTAIRDSRLHLGLSQADLAQRLRVTRAAVQQYERNEERGVISLATLRRALAALGGSVVVQAAGVEDVPKRLFLDTAERLAREVVDARTRQSVSVSELSAQAEVPATLIEAMERGSAVYDLSAIVRVLKALDIEPLALPSPPP